MDFSSSLTYAISDLNCHSELVSESYQLGVFTTFRQDPEINSG